MVDPAVARLELRALVIWGVGVLFVVFQFSLQMTIGVFADPLVEDLQTTTAGVGIATALFALSYALMQMPAGAMADRGSPRRLMTAGLAVCTAATFVFTFATDVYVAAAARLAMGVGAAFGFVGTAVLITRWIPVRHFALFIGLTEAAGMLGAGVSDEVVGFLLERWSWRTIFQGVGAYGAVLSALTWWIVRDAPGGPDSSTYRRRPSVGLREQISALLATPGLGRICGYYALALGAVLGFAGLWNVPFQRSFGIDLAEAATADSLIFLGMGLGCPIAGWASDRMGRRRPLVLVSAAAHFAVLAMILYTPLLPAPTVYALRLALGFAAAGNVLAFAMAADHAPTHLRGAAIGAVNMSGFLGVTAAQLGPGLFLSTNEAPSSTSYAAILSVLLVGLAVGTALIAGVRDPRPSGEPT